MSETYELTKLKRAWELARNYTGRDWHSLVDDEADRKAIRVADIICGYTECWYCDHVATGIDADDKPICDRCHTAKLQQERRCMYIGGTNALAEVSVEHWYSVSWANDSAAEQEGKSK